MRYAVLVLLNLPVILLAFVNILTQYKIKHISSARFKQQLVLWLLILVVLVASFPTYNLITGKPLLDSAALSSFDIIQTSVLVYVIYILNNQRRKIEHSERLIRELHQEISIKLAEQHGKS